MSPQSQLLADSRSLGVELAEKQATKMIDYLDLLVKWNRSFNLTAITDPQKMLSYHLLDSLSLLPAIGESKHCLDVGSGAGLPGIPLAIALPDSQWTLLDSNGKKTRFMQQAIAQAELDNVEVVHSRVEDYHAPRQLDVIVSRAYASIGKFCESVTHLLAPETRMLTMKTTLQEAESKELDTGRFNLVQQSLDVPGIKEARTLVSISQLS